MFANFFFYLREITYGMELTQDISNLFSLHERTMPGTGVLQILLSAKLSNLTDVLIRYCGVQLFYC